MAIPFLQAKHFRKGPGHVVDLVVIRSAEIGESLDGAEALMRVCADNSRVASWHYAADRGRDANPARGAVRGTYRIEFLSSGFPLGSRPIMRQRSASVRFGGSRGAFGVTSRITSSLFLS